MRTPILEKAQELSELISRSSANLGILLELEEKHNKEIKKQEKKKEKRTKELRKRTKKNKLKINIYIENKRTTINISKSLLSLYSISLNKKINFEDKKDLKFIRKEIAEIAEINSYQLQDCVNTTETIEEIILGLIIDNIMNIKGISRCITK